MPGSKTSEVTRKFQEPGIADRILALCRHQGKKPENLAIALGINRVKDYKRQIEAAMDQLIEECDLPLSKKVYGLRQDGTRKQDSYVVYSLAGPAPAPRSTGQEPMVTVSQMDASVPPEFEIKRLPVGKRVKLKPKEEAVANGNAERSVRRQMDLERVLAEIPTWPLEKLTVTDVNRAIGCGNGYLYQDPTRKERVHAALIARREELIAAAGQPESPQQSTAVEEETQPKGREVDRLAEIIKGLRQRNEELEQQLQAAQATQSNSIADSQADVAEGLQCRVQTLDEEIKTLTLQIEQREQRRNELRQKRDVIEEVISLLAG
ncbi:MAG: hypothetical protein AAF609_05590 [Cyanobacteria bacterium P01_C01_bin.120]